MTKGKRRLRRAALIVLVAVAVALAGFLTWTQVCYHAGDESRFMVTTGMATSDGVTVSVRDEGSCIAVGDESSEHGLVLYPGAKVEAAAYVPLAAKLARRGVLCVIAKMPLNIAVLNLDAAGELIETHPSVAHWWVGGHSLGGAIAALWAESHADEIEGVALLASYGSERLVESGLDIVAVCGTRDGVINRDALGRFTALLPTSSVHAVEGGNHAGFGDYGSQANDGRAGITPDEQQEQAAEAIACAMGLESASAPGER